MPTDDPRFPGLPETPADPIAQLLAWIEDARAIGVPEPTAMALATVSADGWPSVRMVLARGIDARGICFYTNHDSDKGHDLAATPRAAATFFFTPDFSKLTPEVMLSAVGLGFFSIGTGIGALRLTR